MGAGSGRWGLARKPPALVGRREWCSTQKMRSAPLPFSCLATCFLSPLSKPYLFVFFFAGKKAESFSYASGINCYSASLASSIFFFPPSFGKVETRVKEGRNFPVSCLSLLIFPKQQVDVSTTWIMDVTARACRVLNICSGVHQFYSALDSGATYGIGKKPQTFIFSVLIQPQ